MSPRSVSHLSLKRTVVVEPSPLEQQSLTFRCCLAPEKLQIIHQGFSKHKEYNSSCRVEAVAVDTKEEEEEAVEEAVVDVDEEGKVSRCKEREHPGFAAPLTDAASLALAASRGGGGRQD